MSALSSQSPQLPQPPTNLVPILQGSANIAAYMKALLDHLTSNYGTIGQNILHTTTTTLIPPGPCPAYNDPRSHPLTRVPIPGSRKYIQIDKTGPQIADATFDDNTLPLTAAGEQKLDHDTSTWQKSTSKYDTDLDKYRTLDDNLLNFLREHNSPSVTQILEANALMPAFRLLPITCITRSQEYLNIITAQFSQGNSTVVIQELTKFLNLSQGPVAQDPTAAFFNRLMDQFLRIQPLLAKATTVDALLQMLLCMVCIKGLNRSHPPSLRALLEHLQKYPGTALDHFAELRASTLAAQDSDISTLDMDAVSEQSSAFLSTADLKAPASTTPVKPNPQKGLQKHGRTDHCAYCLTTFGKYFYHPEADCNFKKKGITQQSKGAHSQPRTRLAARVAALEAPHAPPAEIPPQSLTADQVVSFLASHGWYPALNPIDPTLP
mmetsp:Transcript_16880/g.24428  ORF Transcript_16880/g.24428 Transcript_16880/m.24428 type:complete len:436 (-) Transcript_16880:79-1386(-)